MNGHADNTPPSSTAWRIVTAGILLSIAVAATYWEVITGLVRQWSHDDNYSHGFLILPLATYFAWQRRDNWRPCPSAQVSGALSGSVPAKRSFSWARRQLSCSSLASHSFC